MIACLDVNYRDTAAYATGIVVRDGQDSIALEQRVVPITERASSETKKFGHELANS